MELLRIDFCLIFAREGEGERKKEKERQGKIESDKCYQTLNRLTERKYRAYIIISEELYCRGRTEGGNDESIDCLEEKYESGYADSPFLSIANRDN